MTKLKDIAKRSDIEDIAAAVLGRDSMTDEMVNEIFNGFHSGFIQMPNNPPKELIGAVADWLQEMNVIE